MALPLLAGGSECGPSNPLQTLAKRFDQDRGLQQDYFGISRAGSSRDTFRTHTTVSSPGQEAAQFFAAPHVASRTVPAPSLDLSALRGALPLTEHSVHAGQLPVVDWTIDFAHTQQPHYTELSPTITSDAKLGNQLQHGAPASLVSRQQVGPSSPAQGGLQWNPTLSGFGMNSMPMYMAPTNIPVQAPVNMQIDQISWDKEFTSQELHMSQESKKEPVQSQVQPASDELARTAAMLLEQVKHEQNPKFKNSQFMGLMKQLRDGKITVDGNQMVETNGIPVSQVDIKGKGRAVDNDGVQESISLQDDPNDTYFRQENEYYTQYWAKRDAQTALNTTSGFKAEWDNLQADWDRFEATTTGIKEVDLYQFQPNNPYLLGDSSCIMQSDRQTINESVLELEAAVQQDVTNAMAWYHLGIKQQENEREHEALQALKRAVELDPNHLPSWLALAISYTNDSNRAGTHDSVLEWIDRNGRYKTAVFPTRSQMSNDPDAPLAQRYQGLINCLIAMARSNIGNEIDADIQIVLAVLLNSNEEYDKAQDCFRTALALRPDDWLLYNRVGATMANSGHAEEALQYYYKALELNPGYIRARYNLGISCINLHRYEEAAQHILDALVLQENDGGQNRGVTSSALWGSLKTTCLHMRRVDLAILCDSKDLDGFRSVFQ
ncbi:hypothetical protein AX15_003652 [Amanita polypyramis BW_CC]|nr:hypothetical protein AX15_003652 [Amanita polypyramis BW_CC]